MNTNHLNQCALTENTTGSSATTRGTGRVRAVQLADIHGRSTHGVSNFEWEQARRELNGEPGTGPKEAVLEAAPESERWDSGPDSAGRERPESPSEDEDDEGRGETALLVDEGVEAAERGQMPQAARTAGIMDRWKP